MIDFDYWRKIINLFDDSKSIDNYNENLKYGDISNKNHIPSKKFTTLTTHEFTTHEAFKRIILLTKCEKCNLEFSINFNSKNELIIYNRNNRLTCEEYIIKNIIE